jgi:hypothetical protein
MMVASVTAVVMALLLGGGGLERAPTRETRAHVRRETEPERNLAGGECRELDLLGHSAAAGVLPQQGAIDTVPAGLSVVERNEIPRQPWAVEKQEGNFKNRMASLPM